MEQIKEALYNVLIAIVLTFIVIVMVAILHKRDEKPNPPTQQEELIEIKKVEKNV